MGGWVFSTATSTASHDLIHVLRDPRSPFNEARADGTPTSVYSNETPYCSSCSSSACLSSLSTRSTLFYLSNLSGFKRGIDLAINIVPASGVPFLSYYETATIPHHSSWLRNGAACWFSSEKMIANVRNRCACSRYEVYGMLIQITACCSAIYHLVPELIAKLVAKLGCRQPWICWPKARRRARRRFFLTAPLLSIREHRYRDTDIQTQAESRPDTF